MRKLLLVLATVALSVQSFAAPTAYELAQGLVTIMNANNEADGPYKFLVCKTLGEYYGNEDYSKERSVSEYLVMREGGEIDEVFQVNYSVVTSFAFVAESITRLNSSKTDKLSCPEGSYEIYQAIHN